MSIVYQSERATVILGDARDELAKLTTESVALVIVDPPYGVEWKSNRRAETFAELDEDGAGDRAGIAAILAECVRVTARERHLYAFGPADVLDGLRVTRSVELIWDKALLGSGDVTSAWSPNHERITFATCVGRNPGQTGAATIPARLRKGAIIRAQRPNSRAVRHPTEKPVALLAELIESSSRAGELVLDPCAGSGSTGVAAILRGRRALLIDSDPRWTALASDRIRAAEHVADQMAKL